jgi:hypothetical protein
MSGFRFEMSPTWERDLNKMVQGAVQDIAGEYQRMFDRLAREYKRRPVAEIKTVLRHEWSRLGATISDAELTRYASLISEGRHITLQVTGL